MRETQHAAQKMIDAHGTTERALLAGIAEGFTAAQIAARYGTTAHNIRNMSRRKGIKIPLDVKATRHPDHPKAVRKPKFTKPNTYGHFGLSTAATMKGMTASVLRGEELTRSILAAQVTTYDASHPMFAQVAAEIMAGRAAHGNG